MEKTVVTGIYHPNHIVWGDTAVVWPPALSLTHAHFSKCFSSLNTCSPNCTRRSVVNLKYVVSYPYGYSPISYPYGYSLVVCGPRANSLPLYILETQL